MSECSGRLQLAGGFVTHRSNVLLATCLLASACFDARPQQSQPELEAGASGAAARGGKMRPTTSDPPSTPKRGLEPTAGVAGEPTAADAGTSTPAEPSVNPCARGKLQRTSRGWECDCTGTGAGGIYCDQPSGCANDDAGTCSATKPVIAISSQCSITCALLEGGRVKCWGVDHDALDRGSDPMRASRGATEIRDIRDATQISVGCINSCALLRDGTVRCWGAANLGDGTDQASGTPVVVSDVRDAVELASGDAHHCARIRDGSIRCWGLNSGGVLGDGTTGYPVLPTTVSRLHDAVRIAAGFGSSFAWDQTGALWGWGANDYGLLGTAIIPDSFSQPFPALAGSLGEVQQLAIGYGFGCLLRADSTVYCWGWGSEGQLGNGSKITTGSALRTPARVSDLQDVKQLSAGYAHICAILADSSVRCWGDNQHGQLGDGTREDGLSPKPVVGLRDVLQIECGMNHTCALVRDGTVYCWGSNEYMVRGDDDPNDRLTAQAVPGLE